MRKIIAYLLISFLFLSLVSSAGIKISPTKTIIEMKTETQNCTIVYFSPDTNTTVESRWSKEKVIGSESYNLSSDKIKIKIDYIRLEYGKYKVCFEPSRAGYFYGVIFFQPVGSLVKMGTWVELNVESLTPRETVSLVTGNVIGKENTTNFGLGLIFFLLLVTFLLIVRRTLGRFNTLKNKHS